MYNVQDLTFEQYTTCSTAKIIIKKKKTRYENVKAKLLA